MKYYCKNCGTELKLGYRAKLPKRTDGSAMLYCPVCNDFESDQEPIFMEELIPDYETPGEYKQRTGKLYSEAGLVWVRHDQYMKKWMVFRYDNALEFTYSNIQIVIADPPVPPPDDWRPE